ncbi:unnamed protein product [Arabidopsis thaliana]|uniref:Uncharacterized protein n=1 Tax=Arabidopsis thaliana TaxID=3702 RepID=A0A654E9Y6_ARATH|nr:unnamed protein product [Arabidopsis thaliana]
MAEVDVVAIPSKANYVAFDALRLGRSTQQVVGRLLRFWDARNIKKDGQFMGIVLLLLDEKCSVIHVFIPAALASHFRQVLREGIIFNVSGFEVGRCTKLYKITDHPFLLRFLPATTIIEVSDVGPTIEREKFMLRNFDNLQALANTNIELPGQITFVQGSNLNDPTSTQRLVLRYRIDSSVIVYLSLWDDVAATFRAHLSSGRAEELEGELISLRTSRGARERAEELEDFILDLGRAKMRGAIHPPTCPMELSVFFFPRSSNINSYSLKGASANDERVLKTLNLAPLVKKPLSCRKHLLIMKKCLANNNPDAHYIKGIIWYFNLDHCDVGLHHIGIAANGGQKEAIYIGRTEEGKTYMSQLEWAKDTTMAETCWKQIKTSLNGIRVARKRCYMISLRNMKPPDVCHPRNLDNTSTA